MNEKKRKKMIVLLSIGVLVISYYAVIFYVKQQSEWQAYKESFDNKTFEITVPSQQAKFIMPTTDNFTIQQTGDAYLPDNLSDDIVEAFTDIFWDYDCSSGCGGLLVIAWSYVPGFGANGGQTIEVLFFLFFSGGVIYASKKWG